MNYGEALVGLPITFAYVINCLIDTAAAYGDIRPGFRYSLYDVGNDVGITFVTLVIRDTGGYYADIVIFRHDYNSPRSSFHDVFECMQQLRTLLFFAVVEVIVYIWNRQKYDKKLSVFREPEYLGFGQKCVVFFA